MTDIFLSIVLPTRKRTQMFHDSLTTLMDQAWRPDRIEICVAYDDDDDESHEFFDGPAWADIVKHWGCHEQHHQVERFGYANLHEYVNLLSRESNGDWILFWNDDAMMHTVHWDRHIYQNRDHKGLLHMPCLNIPKHTLFPLFPRLWVDTFGTVSMSNHVDTWMQDICKATKSRKPIGVSVYHDRFDVSGNNNDDTFQDRSYQKKLYKSPEMVAERERWTEIWRSVIES